MKREKHNLRYFLIAWGAVGLLLLPAASLRAQESNQSQAEPQEQKDAPPGQTQVEDQVKGQNQAQGEAGERK